MLESLSFCADNNKQSKVSNLNNLKRELYFLIVSHNRYYVAWGIPQTVRGGADEKTIKELKNKKKAEA